jgi:hypothetical protein
MSSPSEAINDGDHFSTQLSTAKQLLDERNVNPVIQFLERPTATRHVWTLSILSPQSCVPLQMFFRHLLIRHDTQGAFIAGVQALLTAITYTSRSTALDRATKLAWLCRPYP